MHRLLGGEELYIRAGGDPPPAGDPGTTGGPPPPAARPRPKAPHGLRQRSLIEMGFPTSKRSRAPSIVDAPTSTVPALVLAGMAAMTSTIATSWFARSTSMFVLLHSGDQLLVRVAEEAPVLERGSTVFFVASCSLRSASRRRFCSLVTSASALRTTPSARPSPSSGRPAARSADGHAPEGVPRRGRSAPG